jgi:glycosyltransferase involved in cell wall biosynthesis
MGLETKKRDYVAPQGGSDIMLDGLRKHVEVPEDVNIIMSVCDEKMIKSGMKNIVWQHLSYDQEFTQGLKDKYFLRQVDTFVYISHWQHEKFRYMHHIPLHNSVVIKNAIEPIEFIERPKGEKKKLIYTSAPFRGLDILLDSFALLNRDDIELDVYSSTIMYGSDYAQYTGNQYDPIFDRARSLKGVNYKGYASNDEVKKALQSSDIFAYPSIFEETCCLAMVEAGAAGCQMVTTNIGALAETGSEFATLVPIQASREEIVSSYAQALNDAIDNPKSLDTLKLQSDFYNANYSWDNRKKDWEKLFTS